VVISSHTISEDKGVLHGSPTISLPIRAADGASSQESAVQQPHTQNLLHIKPQRGMR